MGISLKSRMGERKWTRGDILVKEIDNKDTANGEVLEFKIWSRAC